MNILDMKNRSVLIRMITTADTRASRLRACTVSMEIQASQNRKPAFEPHVVKKHQNDLKNRVIKGYPEFAFAFPESLSGCLYIQSEGIAQPSNLIILRPLFL